MPIVPRGDEHGVNVLAVKQLQHVAVRVAVRVAVSPVNLIRAGLAAGRAHVADRENLGVLLHLEGLHNAAGAAADTDNAHGDAVARRRAVGSPERVSGNDVWGRRQASHSGYVLYKSSSVAFFFGHGAGSLLLK